MQRKKTVENRKQTSNRQCSRLKGFSLYELSISEIQELKGGEESIDLQQQRDLISEIKKNEATVYDYGLQSFSKHNYPSRQDYQNTKKISEKPTQCMIKNKDHGSSLRLHFNSGIKRKNLSKKKLNCPLNSSKSQKCLRPDLNKKEFLEEGERTKKKIRVVSPRNKRCLIIQQVKILRSHFKKHLISLNLLESPLQKADFSDRNEIEFRKLYHLREDQFKHELNDLNPHFDLSSFFPQDDSRVKINSLQTSRNSQQMQMSGIHPYSRERHDEYFHMREKRSSIKLSQIESQENLVHELKRTYSSVEGGNKSIFSTASSRESPFSRQDSTHSQRPIEKQPKIIFPQKLKRDPVCLSLPRQCQYFIPFSRNKL